MPTKKTGFDILHSSKFNKSLAFTEEEREQLGLKGLLPYSMVSQNIQVIRVMNNIRNKDSDLEKYILLASLQDRNEKLFYRVVVEHIEEMMPIIYTPTVGQACKEFSHIFRRARGFYITPADKGKIREHLDNWPEKDIRVIVITDGQRILGLGDLGTNGMGISIGKLALYTACAGIHPDQCLPVMLDVGTNNQELLDDLLYIGYPRNRLEGDDYFELVEEFVMAVQEKYPKALIQFEDFLTPNAYALLNKYRNRVLCFNDDIQGTASVIVAGIYVSTRITKVQFSDLRIMFLGAGSSSTGIASLIVSALKDEGLTEEEAYAKLWLLDRKGLIVSSRDDLTEHKIPFAHENQQPLNLIDAIDSLKPHILIGTTGTPSMFTKEVIEHMTTINERPVIFALSNPTSKSECTAEQAYQWSNGTAIFASGSPFEKVVFNCKKYVPGQGNNAYVFPGIGLGAIMANVKTIPDELFLVAAQTLAQFVSEKSIQEGTLYPRLTEIRKLSLAIATAVAEKAYELDIARSDRPKDLKQFIEDYMYKTYY
ncbi:MAG: NAD-dependent malic enzyme [Anaerolineaceae bacterium 4572_78]|nr:MAG: NAD-dependent malic enzyme [Anaerolineaceae bacterium 4572_78]